MNVKTLPNIVQLDLPEAKAGVLDVSSRQSAVEVAKVIAVGENVTKLKIGDFVFVKSWAIDIITHEDKKYYFCNLDTNGILGIIEDEL